MKHSMHENLEKIESDFYRDIRRVIRAESGKERKDRGGGEMQIGNAQIDEYQRGEETRV